MKNNKWHNRYKAAVIGLIAFSLFFGTPFLGVLTFRFFVEGILGCTIPFDYTKACLVFGYDIAPRFSLYKIPFMNVFLTPIAFLVAFFEIILLWSGAILFFKIMAIQK